MRTRSRRVACAFESLEGRALMAVTFSTGDGLPLPPDEVVVPPTATGLLLPAVQKVREAAFRVEAESFCAGGGPHVRVFSGASGHEYRGGVRVAAGDVTGEFPSTFARSGASW